MHAGAAPTEGTGADDVSTTVGRAAPVFGRDPLTGAFPRTAFDARLREEVERARRYGHPCSLLLVDLDHFKSVNDAFGHARGDAVLAEFGHRALTTIRASDLLFRYGGDEFALLLPETDRTDAARLASRLLSSVRGAPFGAEPPLSLSLSIGVACFPADARTPEALFEQADARSYEAKRLGRNQVVSADAAARAESPFGEASRLIERDDVVRAVHALLERLARGRGGALCYAGPAGSGHTRLLTEAGTAARLRGHTVLALAAGPADRTAPFAALRRGLRTLADRTAPAVLPSAEAAVGVWRAAVVDQFLARGTAPAVIIVDRWGDLDPLSREVVESLVDDLGGPPTAVSLVCGVSDDATADRPALRRAECDVQPLRPLSTAGTRVWLRAAMRWEAPDPFVAWLNAACGGLPGLLHRALAVLAERDVLREGAAGWELDADFARFPLRERLGLERAATPHNLPASLTRFVGRELEVAAVRDLLDGHRLVTIVGPGGIGKTRLSLEVARGLLGAFPDGVYFVPLETVRDPELVLPTVARALGLADVAGRDGRERLAEHVARRRILLVLDNLEQVVAAGPRIGEVLVGAPELAILATSRERLHVYGECEYPLPPLDLPAPGPLPPADLERLSAVAMFVDRARAVKPQFALTEENAEAVAEICRRLDGLPLAIELAASRVRLLPPRAMLSRLNQRLKLLGDGSRNLPDRQRTLRDAIAWSYDLLDEGERALFRRLGVFAGGFTLEDAEAVLAPPDADGAPPFGDLFDGVASLVDKSLLRQTETPDGEPRFSMIETIREFALERLAADGEFSALAAGHAARYTELAERWQPNLRGAEQGDWLARYEVEHANFRESLDWAFSPAGDPQLGLRLATSLWWFWRVRGHMAEGRQRLTAALAAVPAGADDALQAQGHNALGTLARDQGDYAAAARHFEAALPLAEAAGASWNVARAQEGLGWVALARGDYAAAETAFDRCLALRRALGDRWGVATALEGQGDLLRQRGEPERAVALWTEGLELRRALGDVRGVAQMLNNLGVARVGLGDYAGSVPYFEESLAVRRELGDRKGVAATLNNLGTVLQSLGDGAGALPLLEEALAVRRELVDRHGIAQTLGNLGYAALNRGDLDTANAAIRECLALSRGMEHRPSLATALQNLARCAAAQGNHVEACGLLAECLGIRAQLGNPQLLASTVASIGVVAVGLGHAGPAARLFGGVSAQLDRRRGMLWPAEQALFTRALADVRQQLDEAHFAAAWDAGRRDTLDEAVASAADLMARALAAPADGAGTDGR